MASTVAVEPAAHLPSAKLLAAEAHRRRLGTVKVVIVVGEDWEVRCKCVGSVVEVAS